MKAVSLRVYISLKEPRRAPVASWGRYGHFGVFKSDYFDGVDGISPVDSALPHGCFPAALPELNPAASGRWLVFWISS